MLEGSTSRIHSRRGAETAESIPHPCELRVTIYLGAGGARFVRLTLPSNESRLSHFGFLDFVAICGAGRAKGFQE